MTWLRTEEEVDILLKDMVDRTKGKYITQGIAFNKTCPRQMELLKRALMSSISFSGLGKELLAVRFNGGSNVVNMPAIPVMKTKIKSVGNFL